ncbi:energy transducer TonB [Pedobacter nototheniae]|uniref:energy transducer TonB n=1 Tax=Pedobacter nototheniae TaxID=2488994 RepID=UPI0029304430|nr:hypothetical protein [Pedobacter nototheniae]
MKYTLLLLLFCPFLLKAQKAESAAAKKPLVSSTVDQQSEFEGGLQAWGNFLRKNLDASRAAEAQDSLSFAKYGMRQMAIVKFMVCEDGSLCDFEIVNKNKVSPAVANEALKVIQKSPKWIPAKSKNGSVKTIFQQPIAFYFGD